MSFIEHFMLGDPGRFLELRPVEDSTAEAVGLVFNEVYDRIATNNMTEALRPPD